MAELANITPLNPDDFSFETYSPSDESLLNVNFSSSTFDPTKDYIEFFIYDLNNNIVSQNIPFEGYSLLDNELYIDPIQDSLISNIDTGIVNTLYNFFRPELSSSIDVTYYISEISSDRTELRLATNNLPEVEVINSTNEFINYRNSQTDFPDFYLNFGNNELVIANNIRLDNGTVLIKLYEPLPSQFDIKSQLWVVRQVANGVAYQLDFSTNLTQFTPQLNYISGPNYNLEIKDQLNNSSNYTNFQTYTSASITSSQYQLNSLFNTPGIEINVDYTNFSNFVNFSSATERLNNFYYKASLIESASNQLTGLDALSPKPTTVVGTQTQLQSLIDNTITNFDGYEYYLYFESGSYAWPKTNSIYPYDNASTGSIAAQNWMTSGLVTSSNYDNLNQNYLYFSIPEYIRNDSENEQYMTFINMIGQFFDDYLWVYIKDTTEKYNADNRIDYGVSKELVAQVLRDFGIKLYQSNYGTSDLFTAFLGATESGSLFPFPYVTSSLPAPTGFEYVNTYISSSTSPVPLDDIQKRVYKRIYHNLPYLLKTKGTIESIRTLANIYGIPDTLLQINEFGGKDKDNTNDWDLWFNKFNYKFDTEDNGFVSSSFITNGNWSQTTPGSVQLRFKLPSSGSTGAVDNAVNFPSQSLWTLNTNVHLVLEYTGSGYTSGSYSGSIANPYNQFAHLTIYPDYVNTPAQSASVYLPFFNGDWWSVMTTIESNVITLYAGSNIYSGSDGSQLGFYASQSVSGVDDTEWVNGATSYFASASIYPKFSGSLQEIRYYDVAISESVFQDFIMNPESIEGNGINSGSTQLTFRASLGGELYTGSTSIHPKVTGSWVPTSSFTSDSNFYATGSFTPNTEYIFLDQFPAGLKNRNTDKIRQTNLNLPTGNTLSSKISIQQKSYVEGNYTPNVNLLEVTYSPQNEINDDIISSIGYFNIGDYIGDPRLVSSSATYYPDFNALRDEYFLKYIKNYDLTDFVRLIKYFDNSFFKMVKDFVPARTSLASGITIKQHLLERQKYPVPQPSLSYHEYTGSIGQTPTLVDGQRQYNATSEFESIPIETITGSNGGAILTSNVTQSWDGIRNTPVGQLSFTHNDESEFFNGQFSGSTIVASTGELNTACDPYKVESTDVIEYNIINNFFTSLGQFSSYLASGGGQVNDDIWIWWEKSIISKEKEFAPGYFDYIWSPSALAISKESSNGLNLDKYIPSVDKYTLLINLTSGDVTLSGWTPNYYPSYNLGNLELEVTNIQEVNNTAGIYNNSYYLIQVALNPYNVTVLTDNPAGTVSITQQPNTQIVFTPFVPETFAGSDCNVIYGNELEARKSNTFYDLDYSDNAIQAVNQQVIISASQQSGSATFAPVQDYNWHARRSTIPRYSGSRNSAANYNAEQGFAPIDYVDPIILDFNWGGGTYPEINDGGVLSLNKMLFVNDNREAIGIFAANQQGFTGSVEEAFPINSIPVFNQYSTTATTIDGARVSTVGISTPQLSSYMIVSEKVSTTAAISASTDWITIDGDLSKVDTNSSGYYITGSNITPTSFLTAISGGLSSGERWFVSLYDNIPNPVQGVLNPLNFGYTGYNVITGYNFPIAAKSVFEISSATDVPNFPTSSYTASFGSSPSTGGVAFGSGTFTGPLASSVTNLYINVIDDNSNDRSSILSQLGINQRITLENTTAGTGPWVYKLTSSPIDNGSYFTLPVSLVSGTGNLRNGNGSIFDGYWIYAAGNSQLNLSLPGTSTFNTGSDFGNGNHGLLVWKAQQGSFLLFNDATLSGVGKGGLITSTPSTLVEDEFEYITQNFGSNPKPS